MQPGSSQRSSDWQEHTSADGKRYYYNKKSRQSSWEKPLELMTPIERADALTVLKEFPTPEGRKYYYNKVTKQSKWTIPDELKLAREQAENAAAEPGEGASALVPPATVSVLPAEMPSHSPLAANATSTTNAGVSGSPSVVVPVSSISNPTAAVIVPSASNPLEPSPVGMPSVNSPANVASASNAQSASVGTDAPSTV